MGSHAHVGGIADQRGGAVTARLAKFSYAEMQANLAGAKVGDHVLASVDRKTQPNRYTVTKVAANALTLKGQRGATRRLVFVPSHGAIWLVTDDGEKVRTRTVVQAWLEPAKVGSIEQVRDNIDANRSEQTEPIATWSEAFRTIARSLGLTGQDASVQGIVHRVINDHARLCTLAEDHAALERRRAELGQLMNTIEADRDACRLALGQLRNVAIGAEPGTEPLDFDIAPSTVVIEVTARLFREATVPTPTVNGYPGLSWALPDRMRLEYQPPLRVRAPAPNEPHIIVDPDRIPSVPRVGR